MGNIVIGRADWSRNATVIGAGSENPDIPARNLLREQPTDIWESTGLADLWVEVDRGETAEWNTVALLFTNATSAATWRVRAADTQAGLTSGPDYDSGSVQLWAPGASDAWPRRHSFLWAPAGVARRWLRVDVTDGSNPDGVFRAGVLFVAKLWQPSRNMQHPVTLGHIDPSPLSRAQGGPLMADARAPYLSTEVTLDFLSEAEMLDNAFQLRRLAGSHEPVLTALNPDEDTRLHQQLVYGLITNNDLIRSAGFRRYQHVLAIEEML